MRALNWHHTRRRSTATVAAVLLFTAWMYWWLAYSTPYIPGLLNVVVQPQQSETHNAPHKALVVAKYAKDEVDWLVPFCHEHNYTAYIYTAERNPRPEFFIPSTSKGRESTIYLSYIVDHYDHLPEYSFFIHGSNHHWHNDVFGVTTPPMLEHIRLDAIAAHGYANLRCSPDPGCPINVAPHDPTPYDIEQGGARARFPSIYVALFGGVERDVPKHIGGVCCAQFALTRERIRQRPRADYVRMLHWAVTTELDSFTVGWVFEQTWHIVFGMDSVHCPTYNQCRCDLFGWCGPYGNDDIVLEAARPSRVINTYRKVTGQYPSVHARCTSAPPIAYPTRAVNRPMAPSPHLKSSPVILWNALIRTHHITSRKKIAKLKLAATAHLPDSAASPSSSLHGNATPDLANNDNATATPTQLPRQPNAITYVLLRTGGSPGIMYVEGSPRAVEEWVDVVRRLRYKDYVLARRPGALCRDAVNEDSSGGASDDSLTLLGTARSARAPSGRRDERNDVIGTMGFHETDSVKAFATQMRERGILQWWRKGMGYAPE